jgi:hypothetical protein
MSWHCRLAQIGRNKPTRKDDSKRPTGQPGPQGRPEFNDEIPFSGRADG